MARTAGIGIRIADLAQVQKFLASVSALLEVMGRYDMPQPVGEALAHLQHDMAALTGNAMTDEDRIRDAMTEAHDHPGRTITR